MAVTEDQHPVGDLSVTSVRAVNTNHSAQAIARELLGGMITASTPVLASSSQVSNQDSVLVAGLHGRFRACPRFHPLGPGGRTDI